MRIGLINEGTYPIVTGGVSSWCDRLFVGLPEHDFHVVTLTGGGDPRPVWEIPSNVRYTLHPLWGPSRGSAWGRRRRQRLDSALGRLWSALLPHSSADTSRDVVDIPRVSAALQMLAEIAAQGPVDGLLRAAGSTYPLLRAWAAHRQRFPELPPLTLADASRVAMLTDSALRSLDVVWPEVDVIHCAASGPSALVGLARHWRDGTPIVMTEHGVYLRERYLALRSSGDFAWPVRYAFLAFLRAVSAVAYDETELLTPVSEFNGRWERRLGADPSRVVVIHNGVDESLYPLLTDEPDVPTVTFVGRIDPLKDLHTLIRAFDLVHQQLPEARLRLFGPTPAGNEAYRADLEQLIASRGIGAAVTFEGSVGSSMVAAEAGHVVALSSISEGLPFTVMEAMFNGRATVNTDVGGVSEVVGVDGVAGIVVPPRDPEAMAAELLRLLVDHDARRAMGHAARARAERMFTIGYFADRHRLLYQTARHGGLDHAAPLTPPARVAARPTPVVEPMRPDRLLPAPPVRS